MYSIRNMANSLRRTYMADDISAEKKMEIRNAKQPLSMTPNQYTEALLSRL